MAEGSGEVVAVSATGAANGLNNGAGGTSATTNNPLSRKLHKILETRLDNDKVPARLSRAGGVVCQGPTAVSLV
ncbi:Golgi transport complex subunit 6, partial [Saguinus oedipus]